MTHISRSHVVPLSVAVKSMVLHRVSVQRWLYIVESCDSGPFITSCKWMMHAELMSTPPVPC